MKFGHAHGAREIARAAGKREVCLWLSHPFQHEFYSLQRLQGTNKYRMRNIFFIGDDIEKMMEAIAYININSSRWTIKMFGTIGPPSPKSVTSPVIHSRIRLGFYNPSGTAHAIKMSDQDLT